MNTAFVKNGSFSFITGESGAHLVGDARLYERTNCHLNQEVSAAGPISPLEDDHGR